MERHVLSDTPVRVEYALTPRGEALARPVEALMAWAREWLPSASARAETGAGASEIARSRRTAEARS